MKTDSAQLHCVLQDTRIEDQEKDENITHKNIQELFREIKCILMVSRCEYVSHLCISVWGNKQITDLQKLWLDRRIKPLKTKQMRETLAGMQPVFSLYFHKTQLERVLL